MNRLKLLTTASCLALLGTLLPPMANADEWNQKTVMTFSGPVEIPGVHLAGWAVLPAGTYVFKLLDSQSDRHIVQIFNKDENIVYATILAIPNYRLKATDKTVITFSERPAGEPEALRAWFYPGRNWGMEFVYPKEKAIAIAKATNTPVLFTPAELPVEVGEPIKSIDMPAVATMRTAPVMAIQPTGETVELAAVVAAPAADTPVSADAPAPTNSPAPTLPTTASDLPLIGLMGLMALGAGFAVRAAAVRVR